MIEIDRQLVRERLERKDDAELLAIWTQNNRQEWTPQAFSVIEEILTERLGRVPVQAPPAPLAIPDPQRYWRLLVIVASVCFALFWAGAVVLRLSDLTVVLPLFYLWGWLDIGAGLALSRQGLRRWRIQMVAMVLMGVMLFMAGLAYTDLPWSWLLGFLVLSQGLLAAVYWQVLRFQAHRASFHAPACP